MGKTLLVDGNNLAMRAIHAMARSGLSVDGISTGPLLVCINSLSRHIREEQPDHVVICWDSGPSDFRLAIDPEYKAHRKQAYSPEDAERKKSHFALMRTFLALSHIHQVDRAGFEADDLIARYVADRDSGEQVVILSSDKDFLQLLQDGWVEQIRLSSSDTPTDRWTWNRVLDEYGCSPMQLPVAMALAGDVSDNVPGVPGFGMKTAIKVLNKYGWVLDDVEHPKVVEHRRQAHSAFQLVNLLEPRRELRLPCPPVFSPTGPGDVLFEPLVEFLLRYRMEGVRARLYANALWKDPSP